MDNTYPAKLLLLGEHTILRGSRALAVPFPSRYCYWVQREAEAPDAALLSFATYLSTNFPTEFAHQRLYSDVHQGWRLASTIPVGYGLGSSGAVCLAVFDRYATARGRARAAERPKAFFAQMENYFHGNSSGTDPLIAYLGEAICLHSDGHYDTVALPSWPAEWTLFLLDTQQPRQTGPLVQYFTERYDTEPSFRAAVDQQWITATELGITAWLAGDWNGMAQAFAQISTFQLTQLPPMVLPELRHDWTKGLANQRFSLKICGAGGGGYCLGLTQDWPATQVLLAAWPCEVLALP
ncbi:MAG: hypothetical protein D6772_02530 [Bacteroidetes bacterium]|nr:MAG: hypothetical protein D6772_02530 [Bacteroidota bacterium]